MPSPACPRLRPRPRRRTRPRARLPSLIGATRADLAEALTGIGVPTREIRMRIAQLWHWIYFRGATSFDDMGNVSKHCVPSWRSISAWRGPEVAAEQISADGTRKWLIRFAPRDGEAKGAEVECVYIPESDRGTLCVSSQVGCTLDLQLFAIRARNISSVTSRRRRSSRKLSWPAIRIGDFPGQTAPENGLLPAEGSRFISNIVFMGMGRAAL